MVTVGLRSSSLLALVSLAIIVIAANEIGSAEQEMGLDYAIYNLSSKDDGTEVRLHHHTFVNEAEAVSFLEPLVGQIASIRSDWACVRNASATISLWTRVRDHQGSGDWNPYPDVSVLYATLAGHDGTYPKDVALHPDGSGYVWEATTDDEGYGEFVLQFPVTLADYRLYPMCLDNPYNASMLFIEGTDWNFTPEPPLTIQIDEESRILTKNPFEPDPRDVRCIGYVRYIYMNEGVDGAIVEVSVYTDYPDNLCFKAMGTADGDGRFAIYFPELLPVTDNGTVHIQATDPRSEGYDTLDVPFRTTDTDDVEPEDDPFPWFWVVFYLVAIAGAVAVVSLGASLYQQRRLPPDEE